MIDHDREVSIKNVNISQSVIETHTCRTLKRIPNTEYLTSAIFENRKTSVLLLVVAVLLGCIHHNANLDSSYPSFLF
jgi:hypothetical protein